MVKKTAIKSLIIQHKKNTLKTHFKDVFLRNTVSYSGEVKAHEILLWRSSIQLRAAYPVYHLKFDENDILIDISLQDNPYYKLLNKVFWGVQLLLFPCLLIVSGFKSACTALVVQIIIMFLFQLLFKRIKRFETKVMTNELETKIKTLDGVKI
ncbi:hypothetical protein [Lacinutrix undariae]